MKLFFLALGILSLCNLSHAGWVVGKNSNECSISYEGKILENETLCGAGVLKVSMDKRTKVTTISHCDKIGGECELLENYRSTFFSETVNYLQLAGAGFVYAVPVVVGTAIAISLIGWYPAATVAIDMVGGAAIAAGGVKLASIPDSLDLVRLYNYAKIYHDDFLEDEKGIIILPEDSIENILSEL